MTQDEQHLDLLAIFYYIVGALTALFSCLFLIHVALGIAMLCGAFDGKNAPPKFLAWFFILFPAGFIVTGWTLAGFIIAAGRRLKRRASYTFCLVIAGLECVLMPFGTVLGVFTLVVLMKEPVKQLFAASRSVQDRVASSAS